jgi:hypothetical protein
MSGAHNGLKPDIEPCPKSTKIGIARYEQMWRKPAKRVRPATMAAKTTSLSLSTVQQPLKKGTTINNDLSVVPLRR